MTGNPLQPLQQLAPYIVGRVRRGVVGSSRYACKLRESIRNAASDSERRPVLISGEPGLEKDNIASLIHFGSPDRKQLMLRLDGALLKPDGSDIFGSSGDPSKASLLQQLGHGSLLIDQLERVPEQLKSRLLELAEGKVDSQVRLIFTSETLSPGFDRCCTVIRVPPLRVRRQDLGEWLRYGVRQRSSILGWAQAPLVPEAVVKQLQAYDFPNNLRELETLIQQALQQMEQEGQAAPHVIPEVVFWTPQRQQLYRFDIWRWKPKLRELMRSPSLWNGLLFGVVSWLFVLVNLWLWLGPQDRAHNGALNLFWGWWWPLILLSYPFVGRLWCSFCPFMVWGEIVQRCARRLGWQPNRWPRSQSDTWASPMLAAGFAVILIWEEVWNLQNTAWLSSCLLLVITTGAVVSSLLFEKRFWCRYLCPVGGMNGLFAKLSVLELRAKAGTCSGSCSSYACFKGGPSEGEGLATEGCPLGTHPAHLQDNRNCVLCLTCAQACPHQSVQISVRPPAADIQRSMEVPSGEPALILVLAGDICLQNWHQLWGWWTQAPLTLAEGPLLPRLGIAVMTLAFPASIFAIARFLLKKERLQRTLYGLLPLLWAVMLAQYLPLGMSEGGAFLPVSFSPLDLSWQEALPVWRADSHVIGFCQSGAVGLGLLWSVVLLRRQLATHRSAWIVASAWVSVLAVGGRWLVDS